MDSANYYRAIHGIKNRCVFASVDVHGTYTNVNLKISCRNCVFCVLSGGLRRCAEIAGDSGRKPLADVRARRSKVSTLK